MFEASDVTEMEVQRGDNRLCLRRGAKRHEPEFAAAVPPAPAPPAAAPKVSGPDPTHTLVKSPIVGTYYDAPSPDAPPFVKVGDMVEPGQVLCIIESMKLMNEIEAEMAGTLVQKLIENGRPVEYGEALFAIRPR